MIQRDSTKSVEQGMVMIAQKEMWWLYTKEMILELDTLSFIM